MNKADRNLLISIGVIAIIIVGGYAALVAYTGSTSPFSVVMSQSMQHDPDRSEIGSIDTGDIVIYRDPSKTEIYSYVEGTQNGHTSFGDYGSVIIYNRGSSQNPVIHRAIVWLDYDPVTDRWSAPSLQGYSGTWYYIYSEDRNNDGVPEEIREYNDYMNIRGTLCFEGITESGKNVSIDLNRLEKSSGYLTMGDNRETNPGFDQPNIITHAVAVEDIRSVPVFEIPWLGTIQILVNGGDNLEYVPNSLPSFLMCFITIFGFLILIDAISLHRNAESIRRQMDEEPQWKE